MRCAVEVTYGIASGIGSETSCLELVDEVGRIIRESSSLATPKGGKMLGLSCSLSKGRLFKMLTTEISCAFKKTCRSH